MLKNLITDLVLPRKEKERTCQTGEREKEIYALQRHETGLESTDHKRYLLSNFCYVYHKLRKLQTEMGGENEKEKE